MPPVPAVPADELAEEPDAGDAGHTLVQRPAGEPEPAGEDAPEVVGDRTIVPPSPGAPPPIPARPVSGLRPGSNVRPGSGVGADGGGGAVGAGGTMILTPDPGASDFPAIPGVTITREIGRGGMGVVYEGSQGYLDRRVAVKLLAAESHGNEFTRRFQREAKILASLGHPNIVGCYQAGLAPDGRCFLVMEFIDGPSLEGWIAKNGALPPATAARVCQSVASALAFAHQSGIIHRDVKPANVLLKSSADAARDEGFPWTPMLADLGLARVARTSPSSSKLDVTPQDLTVQGTVMGSPPTMAPEQFDAPDDVDFRTDVYGLGCVLFHGLTGKQAFPQGSLTSLIARKTQGEPPDPRELDPKVPRALAELVTAMLARDPADRPASYEELLARFDAALAAPLAAPPRRKAPVLGIGAGVAVLAAGAWLASRHLGSGAEPDPARETARVEPEPAPVRVVTPPVVPEPEPAPDRGGADTRGGSATDDGGGATDDDGGGDGRGSASQGTAEDPVVPEPDPEPPVDPGPRLPTIEPEETWSLFHDSSPLEAWEMRDGKKSDWSPLEETRNGAQAFVFESASTAERELPAPPWELTGQLEMVRPTRVVTQRLALALRLGPDDALVLRQGIVEGEAHVVAERVRGSEVAELPELALGPLARADYAAGAPVAFRVRFDGDRLELAWSLSKTGDERTLALPRSDFAGPVRLGFELEGGAAILRDFVVRGL